MIEIRGLSLPLSGATSPDVAYDPERLMVAVARKLGCATDDIASCYVARRSIDARKKGDIHFVATIRVRLKGEDPSAVRVAEDRLVAARSSRDVVMAAQPNFELPHLHTVVPERRPVVVGAGAAGLFAALELAEAGAAPILIERGDPVEARAAAAVHFNETGELDPESNIQFGAGGAGTFSDGKLNTGTTSSAHAWILQTFVDAGAAPDILWQAAPHIGSDVLPMVVSNLVARIEGAGGEVRWRCRMIEPVIEQGRIIGVRIELRDAEDALHAEELCCCALILACGHSARDVFACLQQQGIALEAKPFSMGIRIEHPQEMIDKAQYGRAAGHPALPPASYKLSCHTEAGRGVYTFCMCPGGTVVAAASEPGGVVTNGMSVRARNGANANAALLADVYPSDIAGEDPLRGIGLQRLCEQRAFELGGGAFVAPAQLLGDFLAGWASTAAGSVAPTYPRGVKWGSLDEALPSFVLSALREGIPQLARRLHVFDRSDAVLTGVETRSSSPVRILRDPASLQSISAAGLYPCGEGAGYAGGIMSAAADGLRCAQALIEDIDTSL